MKCLASILFFLICWGIAPTATAGGIDDLILMTEEFPPYNFNVDGRAVGSSVDLMVLILQRMGAQQTREDIRILPWARSYRMLLERKNTVLFAYDKNVTGWLIKEEGLDPEDFESVFLLAKGEHYFGFNRQTPDALVQAMQKTLDEIKAEGLFHKIITTYMN
ncbi:MAG TPA: hypothetical protein DHV36_11390 [Desulfobacteraceae bacterium]|nr:hypothetical protein [Desulfobacteraceae bacterium]